MNNADNNAEVVGTPDPVPEGDAAEQSIPAGYDEEPGLDTEYLSDAGDRDANEADVIDQPTSSRPPTTTWALTADRYFCRAPPSRGDSCSTWHHRHVSTDLHVHRYGPEEPVRVLTIHGVTEHGQSWEYLAGYLPEVNIAAPDLLGHGRSSWAAPWSIDANVSALAALLKDQADGPVVVVGHSFGGAVALQLAAAHPDLVAALILLDPAIGLDGSRVREVVDAMVAFPDYTDPAEARMERAYGAWADVDPAVLDAELDEHLITLPNGRYSWRISLPAMVCYWSELARDAALPPPGIATTLVRAVRADPQYVSDELIAALRERLGADFALREFECGHMVPQAKPTEVATLIREQLKTP